MLGTNKLYIIREFFPDFLFGEDGGNMEIRPAHSGDLDLILRYDRHIRREEAEFSVRRNWIFMAEENKEFCGWLRYNLFWDSIPFMNMLFILEKARGKAFGKRLVGYWEDEMRKQAYKTVMTSTASDEYAQHFYRKLGYQAVGGFLPDGEPYEAIFLKRL